ncbi:MAG: hypothetical protein ABUT20_06420 [Bacteroidota bacterium]
MIENISTAVRWTDSLGDNVMITTKKLIKSKEKELFHDPIKNKYKREFDFSAKETIPSFVYHFLIVNDSSILDWKVSGITRLCDEEDENHVKHWFVVTDLDKNSKSEVWLIYKGECLSEGSKGSMKIIMLENGFRSEMSGPINENLPGTNYFDKNFQAGMSLFRKYAMQLWKKFVEQY